MSKTSDSCVLAKSEAPKDSSRKCPTRLACLIFKAVSSPVPPVQIQVQHHLRKTQRLLNVCTYGSDRLRSSEILAHNATVLFVV